MLFSRRLIAAPLRTTKSFSTHRLSKPLRRVVFNVPGNDERKLNKAASLDIDTVVLDYEDGVAQNQKDNARSTVVSYLSRDPLPFSKSERAIRINSVGSGLEFKDLQSLLPVLPKIDSILLPKCENKYHVHFIDHFLRDQGKDTENRIKILAAIESAKSILNLREICESSPRVDALIFASEDYCADTGITRTPQATELLYARSAVVTHAAAYNLSAIDMVCIDFKDMDRLKKEAQEGFTMGFHGKQAIHPAQIDVIAAAFSPSSKLISIAQAIISENEKYQASGSGAFSFTFEDRVIMVDKPMVLWAQGVLKKIAK